MSLRTWLVLFIISMAFSAEVLAWAVQNGQFRHVNRGRWMPLRQTPLAGPPPRHRPWALAAFFFALLVLALGWGLGMLNILAQARGS